MRKKFIYFALIPLLLIGIVVYIFLDSWVESGLEVGGEEIVGAKVEIDDLHVKYSPLGIEWRRMQVTNPRDTWRNLFETGKVEFSMDFAQLLRGKYIIENVEVAGMILNTKRTTDGAIGKKGMIQPNTFSDLAKQALNETVAQTPVFNIDNLRKGINVDSLVKALDLQTITYIDSLKQQVNAVQGQWDAVKTDFESSKERLAEIETSVKAIKPAELKTVDKITSAITTVDKSLKDVKEIENTFNNRKSSVEGQLNGVSTLVGNVDDVVKKDFQKLLTLARLPNLNTAGIANLLVGTEMYTRTMGYLSWVDMSRTYIKKYSPEPQYQKPARFKGQDIYFPVPTANPKFWIKKILVSGGTDSTAASDFIRARGEVLNITNNQTITGKPMTIALEGRQIGKRSMTISALIDRRKDEPYDEYTATLSGVPVAEFKLGSDKFLQGKVSDAMLATQLGIKVLGKRFDVQTKLDLTNLSLQFAGDPKNVLERLVREILQGIRGFNVNLRVWNTKGPVDIALATNLDEQIAARAKAVLGAEFAKIQADLKAKLDARIAEKRREFERIYAEKKQEIEKQIAEYRSIVDQTQATIDAKKKELNDALEKQKSSGLDKLKNLIKKP